MAPAGPARRSIVTITCYGGVGQIGGNQFLLEDGDSRLLFDFGTPYAQWNRFYEEYMKPRAAAGLLDPLVMGLVPPLEGLYRRDLEAYDPEMWDRMRSQAGYRRLEGVEGVLLSHAHLDHSGYISFLRPEVPVYATTMTAIIAKAIQDVGADFEKEVCYFVQREAPEGGALRSGSRGPVTRRPFAFADTPSLAPDAQDFWDSLPYKTKSWDDAPAVRPPSGRIGALTLSHLPVDHSIDGASVFAVETSAGWVAYTGDVRLNWGDNQTKRLVDTLRGLKLGALLCEGTRAEEKGPGATEQTVGERALKEVQEARDLVIADFGPRNIQRLRTFLAVARSTGRKLVVTSKDAYLLDAMATVHEATPTPQEPDILIYRALKASPGTWEKRVWERHAEKLVGPSDIQASPDSFILCFSYWDLKEIVDIAPLGGVYIYSTSEPHNEEQELDLRRLRNWLDRFGMRHAGLPLEVRPHTFNIPPGEEGLHASGHASGEDIVRLVKEVAPQAVIPIHTEKPGFFREALKGADIAVLVPQYGHPIVLR